VPAPLLPPWIGGLSPGVQSACVSRPQYIPCRRLLVSITVKLLIDSHRAWRPSRFGFSSCTAVQHNKKPNRCQKLPACSWPISLPFCRNHLKGGAKPNNPSSFITLGGQLILSWPPSPSHNLAKIAEIPRSQHRNDTSRTRTYSVTRTNCKPEP
jgi:hypothetical protein